jgi:hypothetical protein
VIGNARFHRGSDAQRSVDAGAGGGLKTWKGTGKSPIAALMAHAARIKPAPFHRCFLGCARKLGTIKQPGGCHLKHSIFTARACGKRLLRWTPRSRTNAMLFLLRWARKMPAATLMDSARCRLGADGVSGYLAERNVSFFDPTQLQEEAEIEGEQIAEADEDSDGYF